MKFEVHSDASLTETPRKILTSSPRIALRGGAHAEPQRPQSFCLLRVL
jgi:hypothetical protein